jgi:hypothetical protein
LDREYDFNKRNISEQYKAYDALMKEAAEKDIFHLVKYKDLSDSEKKDSQEILHEKNCATSWHATFLQRI